MKAKLYRYRLPYSKPLFMKGKNYEQREGLIVEIAGKRWGEIAPLPSWSNETLEEAEEDAKECLISSRNPRFSSVSFGITSALLPQSFSRKIPISALLWGNSEETRYLAKKAHENGFTTCKVKLGGFPVEEAVNLTKSLKKDFPDFHLRIDCNQKWSLKDALFFAKHFCKEDFAYLEDPLISWEELLLFSKETLFPIAVDESLLTQPLSSILSLPSLKAAVVKPTLFGGLEKCQKLLKELRKKNCELILSSSFESGIGIFALAKFAEALGIAENAIGADTYRFFAEDVLETPLHFANGHFSFTPMQLKKLCPIFSVP